MSLIKRFWVNHYIIVFLSATIPYVGLFFTDFIHDDFSFVFVNPDLSRIRSLWDCFQFSLEPSRPVTHWVLALTHYLGKGSLVFHRFVSILLHAFTSLLLFENLKSLSEKFKLPIWMPLFSTIIFCVHPLQSETLAVIKFRGEILGAMFLFVSWLILQSLYGNRWSRWERIKGWCFFFLFGTLSTFSKEPFLIVFFVSSICIVQIYSRSLVQNERAVIVALIFHFVLSSCLIWRLKNETTIRDYSYQGHVGERVFSVYDQLRLGEASLIEAFKKFIKGTGLTTIRLQRRLGNRYQTTFGWSAIILGVILYLLYLRGWLRFWAILFISHFGAYIAIPNINVGSEHYLYFSMIPLVSLSFYFIWFLFPTRTIVVSTLLGSYTLALALLLQLRIFDMRSQVSFYYTEAQKNPHVPTVWLSLAGMLINHNEDLLAAKFFIEKARKMSPQLPDIFAMEFRYYLHLNMLSEARRSLENLGTVQKGSPRKFTKFLVAYFEKGIELNRLDEARWAYELALEVDPNDQWINERYEQTLARLNNRV